MFSINRSKPASATLTLWNDRKVSLRCAAERLKNVFSVKGEKNILAFLVLANGSIVKVKSKSMISFVKGRDDDEDSYILSFTIHEILDEPVGNLFDPIHLSDEGLLLKKYFEEAKLAKKISLVQTDFSPLDLNLGVRIIYEHFTQSMTEPDGAEFLFNDFETKVLDKLHSLAGIKMLVPPPDNTVLQVKKSDYWQKALPKPGPEVSKPSAAQPTKPQADAAKQEDKWWAKTTGTKATQPQLPPIPKTPPETKAAPAPAPAKKKAAAAPKKEKQNDPPPSISDIMRMIKETRESRSTTINEVAPTIAWNREGIKSVMTGLGDLERNRQSATYKKQNHRKNYRIYFKDFPGVGTNENSDEFPINIDNISESGARFSVTAASEETPSPFEVNETIMLEISIVGFFDREIFGKIVRGTKEKLKSGKVRFTYAIKFSWIAAPPAFVEAVRKTQMFITAEQRLRK
ncbi:MAG: hypothetical protein HW380_478 [Magnetococcales bacterium]|nr:hypothetical protein [Magnetococcales bacterium]